MTPHGPQGALQAPWQSLASAPDTLRQVHGQAKVSPHTCSGHGPSLAPRQGVAGPARPSETGKGLPGGSGQHGEPAMPSNAALLILATRGSPQAPGPPAHSRGRARRAWRDDTGTGPHLKPADAKHGRTRAKAGRRVGERVQRSTPGMWLVLCAEPGVPFAPTPKGRHVQCGRAPAGRAHLA